MLIKAAFGLLWLGFISYAVIFAPPDQPTTLTLIQNLSTGNWEGINPLIVALFNLMGIWPLIYSSVLLVDGRDQKIPAWPFAIASFGVGAFAIVPYLALRQPNPTFSGQPNLLIKVLESRITAIILTIATITLISYGLKDGNGSDFIQQWQTSRFIHVMSLDFCVLSLIFPALLGDDMARRGSDHSFLFWIAALIPMLGALLYLCVRSPIEASEQQTIASAQHPLIDS